MGLTRHKLTADPDTAPWVPRIFEWRILDHLALTAIARRLDEAGAPCPGGQRWSGSTVDAILKNPKYTGYMVWGRSKRNGPGRSAAALRVPADQWLWSPEPAHPALIDMATWEEAQDAGKKRGKVRDRETPAARDARAPLRGRIRHNQCRRVLTPRPRPYKDHVNLYYACSPDMTDPRIAAKYPGHVHARLADKLLTKVIAGVLDQRVFGPDRAAMLTAQLPATAAEKTADRDRQAAALRRQLKKIETSQAALMTELEETGADPAAAEYRQRIRTATATAPPSAPPPSSSWPSWIPRPPPPTTPPCWPPSPARPASSPPPRPRSAKPFTPPWTSRSCTGRTRTR